MKSLKFDAVYRFFLLLLVSIWLVLPHFTSIFISLFGLVVIYGIFKKYLIFKINYILLGFAILYLIYFAYCFPEWLSKISKENYEFKLSYLIFPFIFSFLPKEGLNRNRVYIQFISFVFILSLYCIVQAMIMYGSGTGLGAFYSSSFSPLHHPTYFAAFISLAVFMLLEIMKDSDSKWLRFGIMMLILYFGILHLPLGSLSGILVYLLLLGFVLIKWSVKILKPKLRILFFSVIGVCIAIFATTQGSLTANIKNTGNFIVEYINDPTEVVKTRPAIMQGNEARLVVWTVTGEIIKEHPLGLGVNHLQNKMYEKLKKYGKDDLAALRYNPHNQFLQTAGETGIIGLIFFLSILIYGSYQAYVQKNWILVFIFISLALNCLFESMLQRQSGIVFYTMWIAILSSGLLISKKELT
jgi:O-antigen ligase